MNLELLSPFRRQIPDRVDATLNLPPNLHGKKGKEAPVQEADDNPDKQKEKEESQEDQEWKAAYHVAFNRRGTYLAVGHASGTVAVHDFLSRTLSALYRPGNLEEGPYGRLVPAEYPNGVTSVTWSRRSRAILAGALGDKVVRIIDTTHPLGPEECVPLPSEFAGMSSDIQLSSQDSINPIVSLGKKKTELFRRCPRALDTLNLTDGSLDAEPQSTIDGVMQHGMAIFKIKTAETPQQGVITRYPIVSFRLPHPVGGSLQMHPHDKMAGLAVLNDGSLIVFVVPSDGFEKYPRLQSNPVVKFATLWHGTTNTITCAAFDRSGEKVYCATKDGVLMCLQVKKLFKALQNKYDPISVPKPFFRIDIPGSATAWHLLVSRNGRFILLNCADSALRVYDARECESSSSLNIVKPTIFQDVVSKVPFASCDFSGDSEYLVGGCNANDKYDLYVWNVTNGDLMDRLTGPQVSLYSVAWHPTRSFLAVATSDGVVDIWGPRKDWTSFAPDFQALPMNVEYIEEEDEFDIVEDKDEGAHVEEDRDVDVVRVEPVPVFASDSESESEVFTFETKISNIMMAGRGRNNPAAGRGGGEEKD